MTKITKKETKQKDEAKKYTYFSQFSLLWKTKKALDFFLVEHSTNSQLWIYILKEYTPKTAKKHSKVSWRDIADRIFSEYIRLLECDDKWYCICPCCWAKIHWTVAQNMHYRSRVCLKFRFDETNCHAGCMRCNVILNGNYRNYHLFMIKMYWEEYEKYLWDDNELIDLGIEFYQEKILEWYNKIQFFKKRLVWPSE